MNTPSPNAEFRAGIAPADDETSHRLPSWPDILRRRTLSLAPPLAEADAALWFG